MDSGAIEVRKRGSEGGERRLCLVLHNHHACHGCCLASASQLGIGGTWLNEILKDSGSAHFITPGFSLILTVWIRQ